MIYRSDIGNNNKPLIVEFGKGDIMMSSAIPDIKKCRDLYFSNVEEGKIGGERENHKEKTSDEIDIQVAFRFHKHESINVLISQLEVLRDELMINP